MTLGTPLMRLPVAGCHVSVDRRQRMGKSVHQHALLAVSGLSGAVGTNCM